MEPNERIRKIFCEHCAALRGGKWCTGVLVLLRLVAAADSTIESRRSKSTGLQEMSKSSDESMTGQDSPEEQSSDQGTESEDGSESGSGSDESASDSNDPSSGSSTSGSGSGEDSDNSADDSDVVSDENESDEDDEEKKAANKREDFEKMKELSAHMDNIVKRFENIFPFHESQERETPLPKLPPLSLPLSLPQPEPVKESRDRSVSARPMTMDRAVSARRLTTDRAVSVASGLHFDDELSGSVGSNTKREETTERHRRERRRTMAHRRRSGDREGGKHRASNRTDTKKRDQTKNTGQQDSMSTESSLERDNADKSDLRAQPGSGEVGGRWQGQVPRDSRGHGIGSHGWHERLLWDELRDSLADRVGSERGMRSKWSRDGGGGGGGGGDVVGQDMGDGVSKEKQRRLIDEAIAVLLEGSSSDEGVMETS